MLLELDFRILDWIQQNIRNPFLDWLMPKISFIGNKGMIWIIIAVIFLVVKKYRQCGIDLSIGLICSVLIGNLLLKNIVARSRPCWINTDIDMLISVPRDFSFPSGHTLSSFIAAVIILNYDKRLGSIALLIAVSIAFSRMYLYVHFPSDVFGGIILGIIIGLLSVLLTKKITARYEKCDL